MMNLNIPKKPIAVMTEKEYLVNRNYYNGICTNCKSIQSDCEPDAENYKCWECGEENVIGIELALIAGYIHIK